MEIINEWDPIDLFPMAPRDEYVEEVKLIYEYLCATPEIQRMQLAEKINEIFVKRFGRDVYVDDINQCIIVADQIITRKI